MDVDDDLAAEPGTDDQSGGAVAESGQAAGPLGFAGAAVTSESIQAAGLMTLAGDGLRDGPVLPMLPSSWGHSSSKDSG